MTSSPLKPEQVPGATPDISPSSGMIERVIFSLLAINHLADDAICGNGEEVHMYLVAIREMSRANAKDLDACLERLSGSRVGVFTNELDVQAG